MRFTFSSFLGVCIAVSTLLLLSKSHPLTLSTQTPSTVLSSGASGLVLSSGRRCPAGDLYLSSSISATLEALQGQINLTIAKFLGRGQVNPKLDPFLRSNFTCLESNLTSTDNCQDSVFKQMNVYKYLLTKVTEKLTIKNLGQQVTDFLQAINNFQTAVKNACGISGCSRTSHAQVASSSVSGENNSNVLPVPTIESVQGRVREDPALTEAACNSLNAEEDVSALVGETPLTNDDFAKQGALQMALRLQKRLQSLPTCDRKRKRSNKKGNDAKGGQGENKNDDKKGDRKRKGTTEKAEKNPNNRRQRKNNQGERAASGTPELVNGASTTDPISFTAAQKTKKVGKAPKTTQPSEKTGADGLSEGVLQMSTRKPRKAGKGRQRSNKKQQIPNENSVDKKQSSKKSKKGRKNKESSKPLAS